MKAKTRWAAPLAWLLALCLLTAGQQPAPPSNDAGKIGALLPHARIFRGTGARFTQQDAQKDSPIRWGDILRTDMKGRARLQLNDGSVLSLGSNSTLRVVQHDATSQRTALELGYGRIRCQVAQLARAGGSFQLRTPTAVAGVIGTDFGADSSNPNETRFLCLEGTVRVSNVDPNVSGSVDCAKGMMTIVRAGQPPTTPVPAEKEQLERWEHVNEPGHKEFIDTIPRPLEDPAWVRRTDTPFGWVNNTSANPPVRWGSVNVTGSARFRWEGWDWFEDPLFNANYGFAHTTLKLALDQRRGNFQWKFEITQPSAFGLPDDAIAPAPRGQLGLGATYYTSNGNSANTAAVFPSQAFIRFYGLGGERNHITLGRFAFIEGMETTPADPALAWLKRARLAHRLIGDFGFSATGRTNDGAMFSGNLGRSNLTLAVARPTRGVFQMNGLGSLDILWAYGALTVPTGTTNNAGELRVFGIGYGDTRAVNKTDNRLVRPASDRFEDITIATFGAHYIHNTVTNAGSFDLLLWGVGQTGSWSVQDHRAGAFAAEVGWQPKVRSLRPWLRLGYYMGSGDDDPNDATHNTFFQILPTPRLYARYPFYNGMNSSDVSATVILRPTPQWNIRTDFRSLWLTARNDLWYAGGGAYNRSAFGFQGRPSFGNRGLANVWDASVDYRFTARWTLGLYYAHAWGKGVPKSIYRSSDSNFGYVELVYQF